jgi:hypothetical protein
MGARTKIQNEKSRISRPASMKLVLSTSYRRSPAKPNVGKTKLNLMFVGRVTMKAQMDNSKPVGIKWYRMSWKRTAALGN